MIHGAPGSGKSTLVQIMAKLYGYHLEVINASDVRKGEDLLKKVRNALEMNTLNNDNEKKPTLLLIDEVDGAFGAEGSQKGIDLV